MLAFGSGRFSFASSTEEVLAFGGSFGVLLATIVSSGFVEGLDRNWAMVILAGTSLGSMAGHKAGIKVGICGELAADEELTESFVRMGVDELSVSPSNILILRKKVRDMEI